VEAVRRDHLLPDHRIAAFVAGRAGQLGVGDQPGFRLGADMPRNPSRRVHFDLRVWRASGSTVEITDPAPPAARSATARRCQAPQSAA
jgi:hypothetical protein